MKRLLLSLAIVFTTCAVFAAVPAEVDIQAKILISDLPLTGMGYFKFAMSDSGGTTNYWSNDGTSPGEPTGVITGAVYNGVFSGILGDTTVMTAIDPDAIDVAGDVYLRIWFSDDNVTFQEMLPAQRVVSTPYAIHADQLDGYDASEIVSEATNRVTLSGDVSGTPGGGTTVDELQGGALDVAAPSADDVIIWDGSAWTSAPITGVTADLYVDEAGDTMTGPLGINVGAGNDLIITNTGNDVMIGRNANGNLSGVAVGSGANGSNQGVGVGMSASGINNSVAVGYQACAYNDGVAVGLNADGGLEGTAIGYQADGASTGVAIGASANGRNYGVAAGRNSTGFDYGIGIGVSSYGRSYGIAIGDSACGYASAVAVGSQANGSMTNIAIGVSANSQGGSERISIGHNVANNVDESARIRGTFYMDGGTGLVARPSFGAGTWKTLIPLPPLNNVIYVATNGTPAGPGTIDRPFDLPQSGYDAAANVDTNSVGTVVIAGGKYATGLIMNRGNVHVLGYSRPEIASLEVITPSKNLRGKQRVENIIVEGLTEVALDGGQDVKFHNVRFQGSLLILGPKVEVQDCYATGNDASAITVGSGTVPIGEISIYNSSMFVSDQSNPALLVNDLVYYFEVIGCEIVNYGPGGVPPWAAIEDRQVLPLDGTSGQVPHLYSHNVIHGAEHGTGTVPAVYDPLVTLGQTICFVQNTVWGDVGWSNSQFYANNIVYGDINNKGGTRGWIQLGAGAGIDASGNTEHQGLYPGFGGPQRGFPAAWQD